MAGLRQRLANLFLDLAKVQGGGAQRAAAAGLDRGRRDGSGGVAVPVSEAVQTV